MNSLTIQNQIAILETSKRQLAGITDVLAAKDIGDKAEAIRLYLRKSKEAVGVMNVAAEVKLRADRKAGELVKGMKKHNGDPRSHDATRLGEIGISKTQSSRWQCIASIPGPKFEKFLTDYNRAEKEITTAAAMKLGKSTNNCSPILHAEPVEGVVESMDELTAGGEKYGTIYADPPWAYDNKGTRANVEGQYANTMSVEEICAMPVAALAADDAHLHLWATNSFLREAFSVIDAWGFEYKSCAVWCKPQIGIGNYWRVSHEFLLLGVRGNAKSFAEHSHRSWLEIDRTKRHSSKPDEFRAIIEKVSPGPYLELFARQPISGWMVMGDQVEERLFSA